jgi:hypothetical protein
VDAYMWSSLWIRIGRKPNRIFKGWKNLMNTILTNYLIKYTGFDYGFSAKTALVCMKFDGDKTISKRKL